MFDVEYIRHNSVTYIRGNDVLNILDTQMYPVSIKFKNLAQYYNILDTAMRSVLDTLMFSIY